LPPLKVWSDRVHYESDVVTHNGGTYQALCDTAKSPPHGDWAVLSAPGLDGLHGSDGRDGRSFHICETYDPKETYEALDVVTLNSTWFVAKKDNPGTCPGPDWKAGPTGKKGERGERGPQGERGQQGVNGREPVGWVQQDYTFTAVMDDGSPGPQLPLRGVFEKFVNDSDGAA
jgi:hypothetical protein